MSTEPVLTISGNLTADPELKFTATGAPVASFTVASTPRTLNRQTNEWTDGETLFVRCSIWRQPAENVAESLTRGARVLVEGRITQRTFEGRDGQKRTVIEMDVDDIGPSLKYATATVHRTRSATTGHASGDHREATGERQWPTVHPIGAGPASA